MTMTSKYRFTRCIKCIKCMTLLGRSVVKGLDFGWGRYKYCVLIINCFFSVNVKLFWNIKYIHLSFSLLSPPSFSSFFFFWDRDLVILTIMELTMYARLALNCRDFFFFDKVLLCIPGWPVTHFVSQADLEKYMIKWRNERKRLTKEM